MLAKRVRLEKPKLRVKLFLDSGVFSAWRLNMSLDIPRYVEFIKRNRDYISAYASMDVIPGTFGKPRTLDEVRHSAKQSYDNHQEMKSLGATPIPIYHRGEDVKWLEQYLKDGEPYIGLAAPLDVITTAEQRAFLDDCFTRLTDSTGKPFVKTHGFGITTVPTMMRYPWFTCDSTTWSLAAGYGLIYVPAFNGNKINWEGQPTRIIMSGVQQAAWSSATRQYEALGRWEKRCVDLWLEHCGVNVHEARYMSLKRRELCLKYFMGFAANHTIGRFDHRVGSHATVKGFAKKQGANSWDRMNVIFATLIGNGQFSVIMNEADAENRLTSYFEYHDKDDDTSFRHYVTHGIHDLEYARRVITPIWNDPHTSMRRMALVRRNAQYAQMETTDED